MTLAVCFNCGEWKFGALTTCRLCGSRPVDEESAITSLFLTDRQLDEVELEKFKTLIASGKKIKVEAPEGSSLRSAARNALDKLRRERRSSSTNEEARHSPPDSGRRVGASQAYAGYQKHLKRSGSSPRRPKRNLSARDFFGGLLWMFFSGLIVLACAYYTRNTVALVTHGIETTGFVKSYDPHRCGSRKRRHICHDHTVSVPPLGTLTLDLHSEHAIGAAIPVTYEEGNGKNVRPGYKPSWSTLDGLELGAFVVLLLSTGFFLFCWRGAVGGLAFSSAGAQAAAYILTFGAVVGFYMWGTAQLFGLSSTDIAAFIRNESGSSTSSHSSPNESEQHMDAESLLPEGFEIDPSQYETADEPSVLPLPREKPKFAPKPLLISTGIVLQSSAPGVAPLRIRTASGSNYYVKLMNAKERTEQPAMTMFIVGGDYFETKVPLGTYELRYAAGKTWYGPDTSELFGASTSLAKADRPFTFSFDGQSYSGHSIELILQTNGNLTTTAITPEEF